MLKKWIFLFGMLLSGCHTTLPFSSRLPAGGRVTNIKKDPFLDSLKKETYQYFIQLARRDNGLIPDRGPRPAFSSVAAVGFGLTAYLVGVENRYISRKEAGLRVLATLRFFYRAPEGSALSGMSGYHGFFYHFLDMKSGTRYQQVELSTIDTGLLLMGILACQSYFTRATPAEREIRNLAEAIYRRVDWNWASTATSLIRMGWHPEHGFIQNEYQGYCEAMFLYILAMGSPSHPLGPTAWQAYTKTNLWAKYQGEEMVNFGPLFGHQYSHVWIDFRGIQDSFIRSKGIDYFQNSTRATLANRAYCVQNPLQRRGYGPLEWGLTACDGPGELLRTENGVKIHYQGYSARGAAADYQVDDGTLAPTALGGSIPFAPEATIASLKYLKNRFGRLIYGQFGFVDAFNLSFPSVDSSADSSGYFDTDYLGIDEGPILIMADNYQTEFIWSLMKKNAHLRLGLKKAGFTGGWLTNGTEAL